MRADKRIRAWGFGGSTMDINPYAAPQQSAPIEREVPPKLTLRRVALLLPIGTIGGALLGAMTNTVNGAVSPDFFRDVMGGHWLSDADVWLASIRQGLFEGAARGTEYAILFVVLTCVFSARRCYLGAAARCALLALILALSFWVAGGATGMAYTQWFPKHCSPRYFGWHTSTESLLRYAWARGAYWGIIYGGLPAVVITSALCVKVSRDQVQGRRA